MVPLFQSFLSELLQAGPGILGTCRVPWQGESHWPGEVAAGWSSRGRRVLRPVSVRTGFLAISRRHLETILRSSPGFAEYQLVMLWRTTVARLRPGRADECQLEEKKLGLWGIATSAVAITAFYSIYESSHGRTISSLVSGHSGQHIAAVHL